MFIYLAFIMEMRIDVVASDQMSSAFLAYFGSKRKAAVQEPANNSDAKKPKPSEYEFNLAKLQKYQSEFQFWNTPDLTACEDPTKHVSWVKINVSQKTYCCWVCQLQYKTIANNDNEVTKGRSSKIKILSNSM